MQIFFLIKAQVAAQGFNNAQSGIPETQNYALITISWPLT